MLMNTEKPATRLFVLEGAPDKAYVLGGFKSFIYRHADTGYKTKWSGFWVPPYKFFDYHAYRINKEWLSPENQKMVEHDGATVTHHFNVQGIEARETVCIPMTAKGLISLLYLRNDNQEEKKLVVDLEVGVDIRHKTENWHMRGYTVRADDIRECVIVKSDEFEHYLVYGPGKCEPWDTGRIVFTFKKDVLYKDHYPGERQRCMIPGRLSFEVTLGPGEEIEVPIVFAASHSSEKNALYYFDMLFSRWEEFLQARRDHYNALLSSHSFSCPDEKIERAFSTATVNLLNLVHECDNRGYGIFAGYPWFLEFWGRDTFWTLLGLVDMGEYRLVEKILFNYARRINDKGELPSQIHTDNSVEYYTDDQNPLFLLALNYYLHHNPARGFERELRPVEKRIIQGLREENGLVAARPRGSWMDTLERKGTPVELQALWTRAMKFYDKKKAEDLQQALDKYWNPKKNNYNDARTQTEADPTVTINGIVPVALGLEKGDRAELALKTLVNELQSVYGARTRSYKEPGYQPWGYHTGSCWGLSTCWAAIAALRMENPDLGVEFLSSLAQLYDWHSLGGLPECVNAENGDLLGCPVQAWSNGLFIHAIDYFLMGIKPNMKKNILYLKPLLPSSWNRMARFGKLVMDTTMNMRVDRTDDGIEAHLLFDREPDFDIVIEFPETVHRIRYHGEEHEGNTIRIKPGTEETVIGLVKD